MSAGGIHANEVVVAIQRDPAAAAADGVAIGRGNAPSDALGGVQGAPSAGDRAKVAAVVLLVRRLRVARGDILTHDLAVAAVDVNHGAHAARLCCERKFNALAKRRQPAMKQRSRGSRGLSVVRGQSTY